MDKLHPRLVLTLVHRCHAAPQTLVHNENKVAQSNKTARSTV